MKQVILALLMSMLGIPLLAQSLTLEDFGVRFEEELEKIVETRQEKQAELRRKYIGALLRIESTAKRQGDLTGVEAARAEIKRVELEPNLAPENISSHPEIARMQNVVKDTLTEYQTEQHQKVQQLVQTVRGYIESASSNLVQQDKIEEAIAWRNWGEKLEERPKVAAAIQMLQEKQRRLEELENRPPDVESFHPALRGDPIRLLTEKAKSFPGRPGAYIAGTEPTGKEKRLGSAKIPSAQGAGNTILSGRIKLIEEEVTTNSSRTSWSSTREKSHLYVARVEFNPLPGKDLGRTLVIFDLYKRGSGSRREVIQTDSMVLPPISSGKRMIVDATPYRYESYKYRDEWGYRAESATADEFYGYIVSFFDQDGDLFYQRATESVLEDYARTAPPEGEREQHREHRREVEMRRLGEDGPMVEIREM